ncbi:MAG: hypothetical protein LBC42_02660 [Puniceicoccales bacterium]|nr:hypothetical protein [Puniceicoccales bacterium]
MLSFLIGKTSPGEREMTLEQVKTNPESTIYAVRSATGGWRWVTAIMIFFKLDSEIREAIIKVCDEQIPIESLRARFNVDGIAQCTEALQREAVSHNTIAGMLSRAFGGIIIISAIEQAFADAGIDLNASLECCKVAILRLTRGQKVTFPAAVNPSHIAALAQLLAPSTDAESTITPIACVYMPAEESGFSVQFFSSIAKSRNFIADAPNAAMCQCTVSRETLEQWMMDTPWPRDVPTYAPNYPNIDTMTNSSNSQQPQ